MKIKREEERRPGGFSDWLRRSLLVKIAVLFLAFLAGALVYRSGILRPVSIQIRQVFTGETLATPNAWQEDIAQNVEDELRLYQNNGLSTLYIDLKFKYYQQLLAKRAEAIDLDILLSSDADFVPCEVQLQDGPKLAAEMRLKGDWTDHLEGDKWSFRIKLTDDGEILHFRQFSIQTPETRGFLNEWAFHQTLLAEGILTTRYEFVNVLLNGKLLGIYAVEDHFTPELLESQGRRQGVIIRFNEDPLWEVRAAFRAGGVGADAAALTVTDLQSAEIDAFQPSRIAADPVLSAEAETARDLLRAYQSGERPASEVFDVGLLGRYFALADLWDARHAMIWHNWRFYYNPIMGLLEPIAFDAEPLAAGNPNTSIADSLVRSGMFDDPQVRKAYVAELARLVKHSYIESVITSLGPEGDRLAAALKIEYPDANVAVNWDQLWNRRAGLEPELHPPATVRGTYQAVGVTPGGEEPASLQVDLVNLMIVPVEVLRFEVDGQAVPLPTGETTLTPANHAQPTAFDPVRLVVPLVDRSAWEGDDPPEVAVVTRLAGLTEEMRVVMAGTTTPDGLTVGPLPRNPSVAEMLAGHPFLTRSPEGSAVVEPGTWDVAGDLVIPEGITLDVPPGTMLRFEPGAILLARGRLNLLGTVNAPVVLTAQQDQWGGIVVLRAGNESLWKYAVVEKTAGIERDGWILTGGITFFESPIRLEHVLLGNNQTEDAINAVHSDFAFIDSEFANTFSDAFDSDFSEGEITGCSFHDIAGDAIDVSGTSLTVSDTRIERIGDKGVSVGEQSRVVIRRVTMDTVGIGVASKDLSEAYVYETQISNARFAALAAYIKKPVYGPASIEAPDLVVIDSAQEAIVQVGSTILLRGHSIPAVELDVDALYQQGVLGN